MQIKKALINDCLRVSKLFTKFRIATTYNFAVILPLSLLFFLHKTVRLNNLKSRTAINAKISVFVICVEAIIYLLLYNLHDCTFKGIDEKLPKNRLLIANFSLFYQNTIFEFL